jgi:hypothetical protein
MITASTWDVFSTLDGHGTNGPRGDWGGYWSKQGPELHEHRASLFDTEQRMVFRATTFRENAAVLLTGDDPHSHDGWNVRKLRTLATVTPRRFATPSAGQTPPSCAATEWTS